MQTEGYEVTASEFVMFTVDGDVRDEPQNQDPEIVGSCFATFEKASAAAHEWAREHPATWNRTVDPLNPRTLTHHWVEVTRWEYDPDADEYEYDDHDAEQFDTKLADAYERLARVQDSLDAMEADGEL